jgi:fumarate hydratase subunit beta
MSEAKVLTTPLTDEVVTGLRTGDKVLISGVVYTARDEAHKRIVAALKSGEKLPFDLRGQIIYYAGPAPEKPGAIIGSCGPTTSYRMDSYAPDLIKRGLKGMIGKGTRSGEVRDAIMKHKAVYFAAVGGIGALLAKTIKESKVIAYDKLGTEAVRRLVVENFPAIVALDTCGKDIYVRCE